MKKRNKLNEMFGDFGRELDDLDELSPVICPLCNTLIPRRKMGGDYSTYEDMIEMHIICINKLPNRSIER